MKRNEGFTMIEMVIATAISVVVFGMLFWGIAYSWKTWNRFQAVMKAEQAVDQAARAVLADLESARSFALPDALAGGSGQLLRLWTNDGELVTYSDGVLGATRKPEMGLPAGVSLIFEANPIPGGTAWLTVRLTAGRAPIRAERVFIRHMALPAMGR